MHRVGSFVAARPWAALGIVGLLTVVLGIFASQQRTDTDITAFAPDTEKANAYYRVQDDFAGGGGSAQVILDAGEGGSVISAAGVRAALAVERVVAATPEVADVLAPSTPQLPAVISFATPVTVGLQMEGIDPATAPDDVIVAVAQQSYASPEGAPAAGLTSKDRDLSVPSARAGLVIVQFAADLDDVGQQTASLALRDALAELETPGIDLDVFSVGILYDEVQTSAEGELPPLLGLSFLLIVVILAFIYRSFSDVVIGVVGLMVSIIWMYGFGVLMGPKYLGLVGDFTQISIVVPVLLVGLGIDYAVHLTSRYREERGQDAAPPEAAKQAVITVGAALVLATVTTLIGFLTNVVSPLPPIGDFGVFAGLGVLGSFVVMGLGVPAVRSLLDRRRHAKGRKARADRTSGLSRVLSRAALLTEHVPAVTLAVGAVLTAGAVVAASGISTAFSQTDFIPEGSESDRLINRLDDLFGGDITEVTHVVIDGDFDDPMLANTIMLLHQELPGIADVRSVQGQAQASSAPAIVYQIGTLAPQQAPEHADRFADLGVIDGQGFAPDADMPSLYALTEELAPGRLAQVLSADRGSGLVSISTTAGEHRTVELETALLIALVPAATTGAAAVITSENIIIKEVLDSLIASQTRSIFFTLGAALILLVGYYWFSQRRPMLGALTMLPSMVVVAWTLGTMRLIGLSYNVLTATVASLAIGIGVPYGIHVTHRFLEDRERANDVDDAIRLTVSHTGAALTGAALTTAAGFGVLVFASLAPTQQFGIVTAITILYSLLGAVFLQPSGLALWDRWHQRRRDRRAAAV